MSFNVSNSVKCIKSLISVLDAKGAKLASILVKPESSTSASCKLFIQDEKPGLQVIELEPAFIDYSSKIGKIISFVNVPPSVRVLGDSPLVKFSFEDC